MIKIDFLDYGVYANNKHIADFDDLDYAKKFALEHAQKEEEDVVIISNFTGEICGEFVVKFRIEVVEVEP